jgi:hypothetical protein
MTAFGSESRGLRAFIAAVWLSCIGVLLPLPWELAQRAEQALDKTYAAETELARQAGKPTPTEPSAGDRLIVTVAGWIEWLWSATVILVGLIVSTNGKLTLTKWATWTVILGALFLLSRVVFEHIVYWSVLQGLLGGGARRSLEHLLNTTPFSLTYVLYVDFVAPLLLILVPIISTRFGRGSAAPRPS